MPQFIAYLTELDRHVLLEELVKYDIFSPIIAFDRGYSVYDNMDKLVEERGDSVSELILYSSTYTLYDPRIFSTIINKFGDHEFSLGGPNIELRLSKQRTIDGKTALAICVLLYEASFIEPTTGSKYTAPESVRSIYASLLRYIKTLVVKRYCLRKTKSKGQFVIKPVAVWISKAALPDMEVGKAGIMFQTDGWKSGYDFKIEPQVQV